MVIFGILNFGDNFVSRFLGLPPHDAHGAVCWPHLLSIWDAVGLLCTPPLWNNKTSTHRNKYHISHALCVSFIKGNVIISVTIFHQLLSAAMIKAQQSYDKFWQILDLVAQRHKGFVAFHILQGVLVSAIDWKTTFLCSNFQMFFLRYFGIPLGRWLGLDARKAGHGSELPIKDLLHADCSFG